LFAKHHIIKHVAGGFAIAVIAATVLVSSASARTSSTDRTRAASCQQVGWITVTDDLGIPWFKASPETACTNAIACTYTPQSPGQAPAGWITVVDDLGIPYLYPVGQGDAAVTPTACVLALTTGTPAPTAAAAPAKAKPTASAKKSKTNSAAMHTRFRHAESVTP
jgi:hypothetical protein